MNRATGEIVSSKKPGVVIGALGYKPATNRLYAGNYGNGDVYEIDYNADPDIDTGEIPKTTLFNFNGGAPPVDCANTGPSDVLGKQIDGLEYLPAGYTPSLTERLALSGDLCDRVVLQVARRRRPRLLRDGQQLGNHHRRSRRALARRLQTEGALSDTRLTRVSLNGAVLGELIIPGYQAEDIAYDSVTFAPSCAVWMNQATEGSPEVRAVAVPCGTGGGDVVVTKTENADFVTLFAVCGTQGEATEPDSSRSSPSERTCPTRMGRPSWRSRTTATARTRPSSPRRATAGRRPGWPTRREPLMRAHHSRSRRR